MAPAEVEFFANVASMCFDGARAHREVGSDFFGGESFGDILDDPLFGGSQFLESGPGIE